MRTNRVLRGDFGWVGLHVCLLHKINPQANEKLFAVGKNGPNATFDLFFLGLGWPRVWGVRRFHTNIYMSSNPTGFGKSQRPYYKETVWALKPK